MFLVLLLYGIIAKGFKEWTEYANMTPIGYQKRSSLTRDQRFCIVVICHANRKLLFAQPFLAHRIFYCLLNPLYESILRHYNIMIQILNFTEFMTSLNDKIKN